MQKKKKNRRKDLGSEGINWGGQREEKKVNFIVKASSRGRLCQRSERSQNNFIGKGL